MWLFGCSVVCVRGYLFVICCLRVCDCCLSNLACWFSLMLLVCCLCFVVAIRHALFVCLTFGVVVVRVLFMSCLLLVVCCCLLGVVDCLLFVVR